jgi:hypothetical protein
VAYGYDDFNNPVAIDEYRPDIIFCNTYSIGGSDVIGDAEHSYLKMFTNYLTCIIPYGFYVQDNVSYHFNHKNILPVWLHFIDSRDAYKLCSQVSVGKGANAVLSGHPMLDDYILANEINASCGKASGFEKTIIYAPHWSIMNIASFHLFYRFIFKMLKDYPSYHFTFKPHPRLNEELESSKAVTEGLTYEDWLNYCKGWDESPNGSVIEDSSFIELFKNSVCLITDSYSFLVSYLPADKPIILLRNKNALRELHAPYYDFIHPLIDSCYICQSEEELEQTFIDIVVNENDFKAAERNKQKERLIYNLGRAGEFIANCIEGALRG